MDLVQSPIINVIGELITHNPETISLGQGVVSYPPPPKAIQRLTDFLANPENHKYKSVVGIPPLLKAITNKLKTDNDILIQDEENKIVVTAGGNMAFVNAILAITKAGDEIILPKPYYFNHEMAIIMANCRPILVETDENYQLNLEKITEAITDKTKAILTVSPNNPTGVVYPESILKQINELCKEKGIYHISDEPYEYFTYNGVKHISPASFPNSSRHTITLYSLSKAYGFASWRIGYMVIPKHLLNAVKKIQDTILICPPVVSQYAALGALEEGKSYCQEKIKEIVKIRNIVLKYLESIENLCTLYPTNGAFYVFLKVNTGIESFELAKRLILEHKVAVIPGNTFGMNKGCYLRIAYGALSQETVAEGMQRLVKGLTQILSST